MIKVKWGNSSFLLGQESDEMGALCWVPAAFAFFRYSDGHLIEYLAMLNEDPKPALGIIPWSKWLDHREIG